MSTPPLSKLLRFLLIAAGIIILLSVIWSFIDSSYSNFLSWIAGGVVAKGVIVKQSDGTIAFVHHIPYTIEGIRGSLEVTDSIVASAIQFGLLLTIALVAATPGLGLKRRFLFTGMAVVVAFILQILAVIVMAKTFNSLFFVIVSDLFPPLLWAAFSLRYWFPKSASSQALQGQSSSSSPRKPKK
jgi:hypothetical protein